MLPLVKGCLTDICSPVHSHEHTIMKTLICSILTACAIECTGCKNNSTGPPSGPETTSHSISWTSTRLGGHSSSVLYDATIISTNSIWAVGEIYVADTSTSGYSKYNLVRWNGVGWSLDYVPVMDWGGAVGFGPLFAVISFSENDVWLASYANLIHWDGVGFTSKAFFMKSIDFNGQVTKMWGTSGSNLYLVGLNGAIYHFSDSTWQKLLTPSMVANDGTPLNFYDVFGCRSQSTGNYEIYAVAGSMYETLDRKIVKIAGTTVSEVSDSGITGRLHSLWHEGAGVAYVAGDRIAVKPSFDLSGAWDESAPSQFFLTSLRGNAKNDVFACGHFGEVLHYNGSTWQSYHPVTGLSMGIYESLAVQGNTVICVGSDGLEAVALLGRRQ